MNNQNILPPVSIFVSVLSKRIPVPYSDDQYGDAQDWLEEYSNRASEPSGDLYQHFPIRDEDAGDSGFSPAEQDRHPVPSEIRN